MSSFQAYRDNSPILPLSPWRARTKDFRRRPLHFRQVAFVVGAFTFTFCLLLFYHFRDGPYASPAAGSILPEVAQRPHHPHIFDDQILATPTSIPAAVSPTEPDPELEPARTNTTEESKARTTPEPVTFALIMWSADSASEGAVLMKSIIMYSSSPIDFHIICDEAAQTYLEKRLNLITRPVHNIRVRFYRIPWESMIARIEREGAITTDHSAGIPGLMKLFIHEILPPTVSKAIFIDTDAFFITDPTLLWDYFLALQPSTAISMPSHPDQAEPQWHNANRICSCIMLLDLARLRAMRLMDSVHYRADPSGPLALAPPAFEAMFGPPSQATGHYEDVKLGDQGYWWAIISHRPEIFEHLSYDWEISSCLMDMYMTGLGDDDADEEHEVRVQVHTWETPHKDQAILPKMLHFNCLDGTPRYYEWEGWTDPTNSLTMRWLPAVRYHVGFKWLWLNRRESTATLTLETVYNVTFADEVFAQARAQHGHL